MHVTWDAHKQTEKPTVNSIHTTKCINLTLSTLPQQCVASGRQRGLDLMDYKGMTSV